MFHRKKTFGELIFKVNDFTSIFKTDLQTLVKHFDIQNWNKNRPIDGMRVMDIERHLKYANTNVLSGIIHAWKVGNKLEVFDGMHRITAAIQLNKVDPIGLLVQLYDTTDEQIIIEEFKNINKSINVPVIYLEQDNYFKRKCIENVAERFCKKHIEFVSPSRNHQKQNFNRDKLIDFISTFEIDFTINNVNEFILKEFHGLNYQAKEHVIKNNIQIPKKCDYHSFYLFYLPLDYIRAFIEKSFTHSSYL